jgi:hypothetical protein
MLSGLRFLIGWMGAIGLLAGCATSQAVVISDGSTAYDVSCFSGRWACSSEAERVCNGGHYVVLEEDVGLGMVSKNQQGSLRIQCVEEYVGANSPRPVRASSPDEPGTRPSEAIACRRAYRDVALLAKSWSAARRAPAKPSEPSRADFMRACVALPEAAQFCLNVAYGEKHSDACAKTFAALDDASTSSLDTLFLAAPPPPRPAPRREAPPPGEQL